MALRHAVTVCRRTVSRPWCRMRRTQMRPLPNQATARNWGRCCLKQHLLRAHSHRRPRRHDRSSRGRRCAPLPCTAGCSLPTCSKGCQQLGSIRALLLSTSSSGGVCTSPMGCLAGTCRVRASHRQASRSSRRGSRSSIQARELQELRSALQGVMWHNQSARLMSGQVGRKFKRRLSNGSTGQVCMPQVAWPACPAGAAPCKCWWCQWTEHADGTCTCEGLVLQGELGWCACIYLWVPRSLHACKAHIYLSLVHLI